MIFVMCLDALHDEKYEGGGKGRLLYVNSLPLLGHCVSYGNSDTWEDYL
jgi:hypothetical protein